MQKMIKNDWIKIVGIVLVVFIFSNLIGYILAGVCVLGAGYYFLNKRKQNQIIAYEEKKTNNPIDCEIDDLVEQIKNIRKR